MAVTLRLRHVSRSEQKQGVSSADGKPQTGVTAPAGEACSPSNGSVCAAGQAHSMSRRARAMSVPSGSGCPMGVGLPGGRKARSAGWAGGHSEWRSRYGPLGLSQNASQAPSSCCGEPGRPSPQDRQTEDPQGDRPLAQVRAPAPAPSCTWWSGAVHTGRRRGCGGRGCPRRWGTGLRGKYSVLLFGLQFFEVRNFSEFLKI